MLPKDFYGYFNPIALHLYYNNVRTMMLQGLDILTGFRWDLSSPFVVFTKFKTVFLAIPRSGTTSLEYALTPLLGQSIDFTKNNYKHTFRHYMRSCSRREAATNFNNYFKFTFVRNPWTRLYSCYLAKVRSKSNRHFRYLGLDRCNSFEDFVIRICDISDDHADMHFMSQNYLLTYKGSFLPDKVYRFESYMQDWNDLRRYLEEKTGIHLLEIPHYYKMKSDDFRRVYSSKLVDLVGKRYEADCNKFGYTYPG